VEAKSKVKQKNKKISKKIEKNANPWKSFQKKINFFCFGTAKNW